MVEKTTLREPPNWPMGKVVHCEQGHEWVYIGWCVTTVGSCLVQFTRTLHGRAYYQPWRYQCSTLETLKRKFPDCGDY
jgi:hypothetical protein